MKRTLALVIACASCAAAAQSGPLADPTRPPNVVPPSAARETAAAPKKPELQSVLISPTRRVAVISGTTVAQGGKFGDATVAQITEGTVLLRYADRRETLHLMPGIEKRDRRATGADSPEKGAAR